MGLSSVNLTSACISPNTVLEAIRELRARQAESLTRLPQGAVVEALGEFARLWRDPDYPRRREAETWDEPFPFAMVSVSLDALLDSLAPDALWALIDAETVREAFGYPVVGHFVAGNTPLLAWGSIVRALLVRSASLVKLPSGPAALWGRLFHESLADVSSELAACVHLMEWPGGTEALDTALCTNADCVIAYGSDATLQTLKALCPAGKPFVGYGHRLSFGLAGQGGDTDAAALGFARDVLLYDQGGCLSPQTIFVEGDWDNALTFAARLAAALAKVSQEYPLPKRAASAAGLVRAARALAWMEEGNHVWEDPALRWTVIARPESVFAASPTFGVVSVQPLTSLLALPEAVAPVAATLQGCAVAGKMAGYLPNVSWLCEPGQMQAPPLSWRQDGRDVLRVLCPGNTEGT